MDIQLFDRNPRATHLTEAGKEFLGRTTKIHIAVDEKGRPRRLIIRPGHRGDAGRRGDALVTSDW